MLDLSCLTRLLNQKLSKLLTCWLFHSHLVDIHGRQCGHILCVIHFNTIHVDGKIRHQLFGQARQTLSDVFIINATGKYGVQVFFE